ncbi:MAG TPA: DinB family protein, partial [Candidatus Acidoferrum sp.]
MAAITSAVRLRHNLSARLTDARKRSDELFAIVRSESMYDRPIPERHRIIFYVGHLEAFDWNLLAERAFGLRPFQRTFDQLFSFGIDPVGGGLPTDTPADWPSREEITKYVRGVRESLDHAIDEALSKPDEGHPQLKTMLEVAIEHRLMHSETLAYMLHRLPTEKKHGEAIVRTRANARTRTELIEIPAGRATLGLEMKPGNEFGWDNEMEGH